MGYQNRKILADSTEMIHSIFLSESLEYDLKVLLQSFRSARTSEPLTGMQSGCNKEQYDHNPVQISVQYACKCIPEDHTQLLDEIGIISIQGWIPVCYD
jgi:hypothetical protein